MSKRAYRPSKPGAVASKLPFYASGPIIYDADDNEVAECWNPRGPGSAEDNAKRMATATNSHAALVQALKACRRYMTDDKSSDVTGRIALDAIAQALKLAGQEE